MGALRKLPGGGMLSKSFFRGGSNAVHLRQEGLFAVLVADDLNRKGEKALQGLLDAIQKKFEN